MTKTQRRKRKRVAHPKSQRAGVASTQREARRDRKAQRRLDKALRPA